MSALMEVPPDEAIDREKALGIAGGLKPLHTPQRASLTPKSPQDEEQKQDETSSKHPPRDPNTSSLYVSLRLQTQQVPEALFFWNVIEQPHSPPPCRTTTTGSQTKCRRSAKVYS